MMIFLYGPTPISFSFFENNCRDQIRIPSNLHNLEPRAVVVAQLVERAIPFPEVHSLNPVISKNAF